MDALRAGPLPADRQDQSAFDRILDDLLDLARL